MGLKFYNTLTATKEEFVPLKEGLVKMYTCGPTVYDYAHIGNFRAYIFEDLLRRYLEYKGFKVIQVMNLTDIDDKTIKNSIAEGQSLGDYTSKYIKAFFEDLGALNIEKAEFYPKATEHIPEMLELIEKLIDKGYAYENDGSIYFRISAFKDYGKLSKKNLDKNIVGARVDHDEYERDDLRDFVLWKKYKEGEPFWESPYGKGRPGWHIECSAMSMKYLGKTFDIHTGGEDNIFPHHENEIAQSESATGKKFANYWMHCKFLLVNNEKMSKSKGNFYTLRDLLAKGYSASSVRFLLLSHNYRHPLNFTLEGLEASAKTLDKINLFYKRIEEAIEDETLNCKNEAIDSFLSDFEEAMDDDLNIAKAIAILFDFISFINKEVSVGKINPDLKKRVLSAMQKVDKVLGVLTKEEVTVPLEVENMLQQREEARKNKQYDKADKIRDELNALGWRIEDTPQGARVIKK